MSNEYSEQYSNPVIESTLKDWREQGGLTRMEGSSCTLCNKLFYPRRSVCPFCHNTKMKIYRFKGHGTILNIISNNISQVAIVGYRELLPRMIAIIKLYEGPIVLGEVIETNDNANNLLGKNVKSVLRKQSRSSNTTWKYGYKFILCKEDA